MEKFWEPPKLKNANIKNSKYHYKWNLKNANFTKDKGTVFSCFACGGSTMGYKLAGFDVIGCNEIDHKMIEVYKANHNPKYAFLESIETFKNRDDLPEELYSLDILDGSPPCSSFSMAGNREKDWGKEKRFREGQAKQVLDTLFFDFIDLAEELQPKVVVTENVKGLLLGKARVYVTKILQAFDKAGYYACYTLLNAANMGIPQQRERVVFTAIRKDLHNGKFKGFSTTQPYIRFKFFEKPIPYREIKNGTGGMPGKLTQKRLKNRRPLDKDMGSITQRCNGKRSDFNTKIVYNHQVMPTIRASSVNIDNDTGNFISDTSMSLASSFPTDFNFLKRAPVYILGMSVPPIMIAKIIDQIYYQWDL